MRMVDDQKEYVRSSNSSTRVPYSHSSNAVPRYGARAARNFGPGQHILPCKVAENDGQDIKSLGRTLRARSILSTNQVERRQRKQRQRARSPIEDESIEEDWWKGLGRAERNSPRYLQYREGARKRARDKNNQGNVWPDDLEEAFQIGELARLALPEFKTDVDAMPALRYVPPRGRKKEQRGHKLCGRNELLSEKILLWTGVYRSRKQISSHIQVLKGFMMGNDDWMRNVTSIGNSGGVPADQSILDNVNLENMKDEDLDLFARSRYGHVGPAACPNALAIPPPDGILRSNAPNCGPYLRRVDFEMFVVSPTEEKIHNYTSNQADIGGPAWLLEDVPNWRVSFPHLKEYYEQDQLDSEIILIESRLDLLGEYPPKGSKLSIGFKANVAGLTGGERWSTKADYYEKNGKLVDMGTFYARDNVTKKMPWDTPNVFAGSSNSEVNLEIPLQSIWWVHLFTKMAARKLETKHDSYLRQQEDEWSRRYLQEMSIMQELWVDTEGNGASGRRIAIILWKFSQTRAGHAGTTTWRKLKPPPARNHIDSPSPSPLPPLQHSMSLDSAVQDLAMPQAISVNTERFLHNVNAFAEDREQLVTEPQSTRGSTSPALSPDYSMSFPSSTSTSFPPSVSHGYLSHEESQDSACYSQESECSRKGSLDNQYSYMFSRKSTYTYQEPNTYTDDLGYFPASHEVESQDVACYPQQSFNSIRPYFTPSQYGSFQDELVHDASFDAHYYSNEQIQLSFEQNEVVFTAQKGPAPNVVHAEDSSEAQPRTNNQESYPVTHGFSVAESDTTAMPESHHVDFDFSTLETHFTLEEIADLRMHGPEHHHHGELVGLLRNHGEVQDFDQHNLSANDPYQHHPTRTLNYVNENTLEHKDHGVVLGEVEEEDFGNVAQVLGFEEVDYEESQAVDGQAQGIDEFDYEHLDRHDAL
ncbi:MAG: hypothetical protein Q9184_001111 [Pyrenodesmia sp. 2 TL-2023]